MARKKWKNRLLRHKWIFPLVKFLDTIEPPGLEGMTAWNILLIFLEGVRKGALTMRASAISFRIFLAFFPGIILLLTIIPLVPIDNFQENLFNSIRDFFPGDTFSLFESTIFDLLTREHNALLSIGFVLVLYYASDSVNAILQGFDASYHLEERGNPFAMRVASLILIFVLGFFMIIAVGLIVFSGSLFNYLHEIRVIPDKGMIPLLIFIKWIVSALLIYTVITTLYNVGHRRGRRRWKFFNPGATFATAFFVLASMLFAWFVNNVAEYNKLYGSLGTLLVLLIWMNFNSIILLMGFELNASISKAKRQLLKQKPMEKPVNTLKG